jgi:hypothetical protein
MIKRDNSVDRSKNRNLILGPGVLLLLILALLAFNPARTLLSFRENGQVPLYTMTYHGPYYYLAPAIPSTDANLRKYGDEDGSGFLEHQACTIFSATGGDHKIYGRNRDLPWDHTALLLFTHPKNGYASVSMVDLDQLGVYPGRFSLWRRLLLLAAPLVPTEGMNEHGLTVSKADVSPDDPPYDPSKETLMFRTAMRLVLDQAKTTQEAIDLLALYNISFAGGGGHLLIADPSGDSAILEYFDDQVVVIRNPDPWQVITNFEVGNPANQDQEPNCQRYNLVEDALNHSAGVLNIEGGMDLLSQASVNGTLWSISFDMTTQEMDIVLNRQFENVFHLTKDEW